MLIFTVFCVVPGFAFKTVIKFEKFFTVFFLFILTVTVPVIHVNLG